MKRVFGGIDNKTGSQFDVDETHWVFHLAFAFILQFYHDGDDVGCFLGGAGIYPGAPRGEAVF